jgi:hypothetical protein
VLTCRDPANFVLADGRECDIKSPVHGDDADMTGSDRKQSRFWSQHSLLFEDHNANYLNFFPWAHDRKSSSEPFMIQFFSSRYRQSFRTKLGLVLVSFMPTFEEAIDINPSKSFNSVKSHFPMS